MKIWQKVIVRLWKEYQDNGHIHMADYGSYKDKSWIYHLWRWGCLTKIDRGVYRFNRKGREIAQAILSGKF